MKKLGFQLQFDNDELGDLVQVTFIFLNAMKLFEPDSPQ